MNDNTKVTSGKYKGKLLKDVPDKYFFDLYDDCSLKGELKKYAIERIPLLHYFEEAHEKDCNKEEERVKN